VSPVRLVGRPERLPHDFADEAPDRIGRVSAGLESLTQQVAFGQEAATR
jgi:hypothetical protein